MTGGNKPAMDSSVITLVVSPCGSKYQLWIARMPTVIPLHPNVLFSSTVCNLEWISAPSASHVKCVPLLTGSLILTLRMSFCHFGQLLKSVIFCQTFSTGALMMISLRATSGAFFSISIVTLYPIDVSALVQKFMGIMTLVYNIVYENFVD